MSNEYRNIDTEILGRMLQAARHDKDTPQEQLELMEKAFAQRREELEEQLSLEETSEDGRPVLELYQELIALEPDSYLPYFKTGWYFFYGLRDYHAAIAHYTAALNLIDDEPDRLCEIYQERARSFLRLQEYSSALDDGKMALRLKYRSETFDNPLTETKFYGTILYIVRESLRHLGNEPLADKVKSIYELAEHTEEGVTDALVAEFFSLLGIPAAEDESKTQAEAIHIARIEKLIPTDPLELQKRALRKQFFDEYQNRAEPDFLLLFKIMQQLITLEPANYRYCATAGDICVRLGDFAAANSFYITALQLIDQYPGDPWWQRNTRRNHLHLLYRLIAFGFQLYDNFEQAMKHYELAVRAKPDHEQTPTLVALMVACYDRLPTITNGKEVAELFKSLFDGSVASYANYYIGYRPPYIRFVEFSEIGTEEGQGERIRRQTAVFFEHLTAEQEKSEKAEQLSQKEAEQIDRLDKLLRLMGRASTE